MEKFRVLSSNPQNYNLFTNIGAPFGERSGKIECKNSLAGFRVTTPKNSKAKVRYYVRSFVRPNRSDLD